MLLTIANKIEGNCNVAKYVKKTDNPNMGRPIAVIDWEKVKAMCRIFCTESEIAAVLDVHIDTLLEACKREHNCTFPDFFKKFSEDGKASLRRAQYKRAMEGHPTMLIWLGKQYLGQKDQVEMSTAQPIQLGYDPAKLWDDE